MVAHKMRMRGHHVRGTARVKIPRGTVGKRGSKKRRLAHHVVGRSKRPRMAPRMAWGCTSSCSSGGSIESVHSCGGSCQKWMMSEKVMRVKFL